ncbi:MAG: hypothetical protein JXR03_21245 [Cyclobacteriaceae bacterium]
MIKKETMVTTLKPGAGKRSIQSLLKKLGERKPNKVIDATKYCGKVHFKEDGLELQKRWRDEW